MMAAMKMFKMEDGSFCFDEIIEIAYCPICEKSLYLRPYTLVKGSPLCTGEVDMRFVRYSTHCDICKHRVEVCVPCHPLSLPKWTEIITIS